MPVILYVAHLVRSRIYSRAILLFYFMPLRTQNL